MTGKTNPHEKVRAVFLAAIMVLSVLAMSAAFAGSAAAIEAGNITVDAVEADQPTTNDVANYSIDVTVDDDSGDDITDIVISDTNNNLSTVTNAEVLDGDGDNITNSITQANTDELIIDVQSQALTGPVNITLVGVTNTDAPGDYDVTVEFTSDTGNADSGAVDTNTVTIEPSLIVSDLSGPNTATANEEITFEATVENVGETDATGPTIRVDAANTSGDLENGNADQTNVSDAGVTPDVDAGSSVTVELTVNSSDYNWGTDLKPQGERIYTGITVSSNPFESGSETLFVSGTSEKEGSITANIQDGSGADLDNATVNLYHADDWTGTPSDSTPIRTADPAGDGVSTVTFENLAVGTSDDPSTHVDYVLYAVKDEFNSDSTRESLHDPDNVGPTRVLTLQSALEPNVLGVGAFDADKKEVTGNTSAMFANGQFDNQAQFVVFAQTQSDNEANQPISESLTVHIRAENASDGSPLEFVTDQTDENTSHQISVTIDSDSPTANVDGNSTTGVFSYETFNVTALNATNDNVDPLRTEDMFVWTDGLGNADVTLASELYGPDEPDLLPNNEVPKAGQVTDGQAWQNEDTASTPEDVETDPNEEATVKALLNDVFYFVEGDRGTSHEVVDLDESSMVEDATVWAAYEGGPQDLDEIEEFKNAAGESFLIANPIEGEDGEYVIPGLVADANFNIYVQAQEYNRFNSSEVQIGTGTTLAQDTGISEDTYLADFTLGRSVKEASEGGGEDYQFTHMLSQVPLDFRLDLTAANVDGEQVKIADVPAGETTEVDVQVEAAEVGAPAEDFEPIEGQEIEVELVDTGDGILGSLDAETVTTNEDGVATVNFTATEDTKGSVNVSATTYNSENTEYTTADGEGDGLNDDGNQTQLDVFTTGYLTGDIVDENQDSVPGATVWLDQWNTTNSSWDQVRDVQEIPADANYVFADLSTNEDYRVQAQFEGDDGFATINDLNAGTNTRDVVIEGLVLQDATFQFSEIDPAADVEVEPGATVSVNATVENIGQLEGTETIQFVVDGDVADEQELNLPGDSNDTVTLEATAPDAEGDYDWSIQIQDTDEMSDTWTLTVNETTNSGDGDVVDAYDANDNGVIEASELATAFDDWQTGDLDSSGLQDVFEAWQSA